MTGIDEMLRRLFDYNRRYQDRRRRKYPALSEEQVALACANALAQAVQGQPGFGWIRGRVFREGQIEERRRTASGQSLIACCAVTDNVVLFDFGIAAGTRPSPGSAFPHCGHWSGVFHPDSRRNLSASFINQFREHARHQAPIADALFFVRQFFNWSAEDMNKPLKVNCDERHLPFGLKPRTAQQAAAMVEDLLERCDQRGQFLLRVREQKTMRGNARIRVGVVVGSSVRITVRPGDGGTCWVYDLACPGTVNASALADKLMLALSQREEDDEEAAPAADRTNTEPGAILNPPTKSPETKAVASPTQNGSAQNGSADTADVLKLLAGAIERKRDREQRLASLEKLRQDLVRELEAVQGRIKDVERRQEALLAEEEGDAQGRAVDDVLRAISRVFKPTTADQVAG